MSAVRRRRADRQDRPAEPLPASAVPIEEAARPLIAVALYARAGSPGTFLGPLVIGTETNKALMAYEVHRRFFLAKILHQPHRLIWPATSVHPSGGTNIVHSPHRSPSCG